MRIVDRDLIAPKHTEAGPATAFHTIALSAQPANERTTNERTNMASSRSYLSTRGGSSGFSFEDTVLKGLAADGGLFIPEAIPALPDDWQTAWSDLTFQELAFNIFSAYISPSEIPVEDLKALIHRSYATFRHPAVTPLVPLLPEKNLHLLELFHGPTFAFKDVALQFVGNLFEYFLERRNRGKSDGEREVLTVIGATSGDTGSAAIYGLRGKKDISVFILHPKGKISPIQEAQMTSVLDANVHNLAVVGTFDNCQDIVKELFADADFNARHKLGAVNSINWARILAQIVYYFHSYFALRKSHPSSSPPRFVVPTGNFGDVLAGYFAKRMGLPIEKLVVATNENDILNRFWRSGRYEIHTASAAEAEGGIAADGAKAHPSGVKETLSPAMDILVSSNFERLLWYLAFEKETSATDELAVRQQGASARVKEMMASLKAQQGFSVTDAMLQLAREDFESERVSDDETVETIRTIYVGVDPARYILDPHSAVGVTAALRHIETADASGSPHVHQICLSTAHPAKFSHAVDLALKEIFGYQFADVLPVEFKDLLGAEKRVENVPAAESGLVKAAIERLLENEKLQAAT
ncbi:threonine synthase [Orbilia brochopaga]|uniref:threonine synthase n=1 Tax=Orbilia brochopaga TaxID=3140254 RepID=A0AAV9V211_9PEZI